MSTELRVRQLEHALWVANQQNRLANYRFAALLEIAAEGKTPPHRMRAEAFKRAMARDEAEMLQAKAAE